ncbi:MAG: hypothetical protein ACYDEX_24205 [Mobilitalea sp.]
MSTYIDTNILYRYSQVMDHQKFDIKKIKKKLQQYPELILTEFSILELFTHKDFSHRQIKKVLNFVKSAKNIKYLPIAPEGFDPLDITELMSNIKSKKLFYRDFAQILSRKTVLEARIMSYFIQSILVVYMMMLNASDPTPLSTSQVTTFTYISLIPIFSFKEVLSFNLIGVINSKYYDDKNDSWFKTKMEDLLLPALQEIAKVYFSVKNGFNYHSLTQQQEQTIFNQFTTNPLTNRLHQRITMNNGALFDNTCLPYYNQIYNSFEAEMVLSIPIGVVKYFGVLIKRVLFNGRKLLKNDMMDSQFLTVYPNDALLSVDEKYIGIINEYDTIYASAMTAFNNAVLK